MFDRMTEGEYWLNTAQGFCVLSFLALLIHLTLRAFVSLITAQISLFKGMQETYFGFFERIQNNITPVNNSTEASGFSSQ